MTQLKDVKRIKTSVRKLVEFVLRRGDLQTGFQGPGRAVAGTRGHQQVQKSRPDGYETEVSIHHAVEKEDLHLEIFGRIDGIFVDESPIVIEEIKTTRHELDLIDQDYNPLHWAQAQCYAYIYALQHDLTEIGIQLTYYHLDTRELKPLRRVLDLASLADFFEELVTTYLGWMRRVLAWLETRDRSIEQLDFPYPAYREGQRNLAVAVYKTIRANEKLFVQAPTGVGKTIATLFPAVKAMGLGLTSKIFYLTAKTPGRAVAEKAIDDMRAAGLRFKCITLTAKEKICFCPEAVNDPDRCEFSRNYYGKVKAALADAYQHEAWTRSLIEEIAHKHGVCPFEFSLDLSLWADCIICDYNYAFDPRVYLRRFFDDNSDPYVFLIDEAHNLPDRARSMYSTEIEQETVLNLKRTLKPHLPDLTEALAEIYRVLLDKRRVTETMGQQALVEVDLPETLLSSIFDFIQKAEAWLSLNQSAEFRQELLEFYFQCITYGRTADNFAAYYVSYFEKVGKSNLKAKLFCLDPAPLLELALARGQATIFFSATLWPMDYFQQVLTGSNGQAKLILPSPFPQENLSLFVHNRISTRYANRAHSYEPIAAAIEAICAAQPGNYLIFFPSYAYLNAVVERLRERFPAERLLVQDRAMTEVEREAFLAQFSATNTDTLVGCAVLGGIFGEGIDLVGDRLIGAVVIGVGLPQLCLERDLIKNYFNQVQGQGFQFAYQFPGLNRVMQAAGRVIRSEQDRGIIVLIYERFTQARYRALFPREWRGFQPVSSQADLTTGLARFWRND
jgi:DNA excision repair protein ERCC-2